MNINDLLARTGGFGSIANELGISESQAATGAEALLPAILGGFKRQAAARPTGVESLGGLLGQMGGGGLLDNLLSPEPTQVNRGNDVLGHIFGSKDVSREVAKRAATKSGLSADLLKKMLPMLAMLVTGYMSRQQSGAAAMPFDTQAGGARGSLGGLGAMLDMDGDGNPLDDVIAMVQRSMRQ